MFAGAVVVSAVSYGPLLWLVDQTRNVWLGLLIAISAAAIPVAGVLVGAKMWDLLSRPGKE